MLKNISPLMTPDALHALASMGHGDEVAIVDANFPAARVAQQGGARLVQLAGATAADALKAVLQVLPLDNIELEAAWTMQVVGDAQAVPAPVSEFAAALAVAGEGAAASLERFDFYRRAAGEQYRMGKLETALQLYEKAEQYAPPGQSRAQKMGAIRRALAAHVPAP